MYLFSMPPHVIQSGRRGCGSSARLGVRHHGLQRLMPICIDADFKSHSACLGTGHMLRCRRLFQHHS